MSKRLLHRMSVLLGQCRAIGVRKTGVRNHGKEAQLPIFQYPASKQCDRRVYVWGLADTGSLGISMKQMTKTSIIKTPSRLSFAEKHRVSEVTCGFGFTIYSVKSDNTNKLYGTGINTDSQIGYHEVRKNHPLELLLLPVPISLPFQADSDTEIKDISAGRSHLLVLTSNGLFTLGNNAYGQCGRTIIENENYSSSHIIHHLSSIENKKIVSVRCGQDQSMLLTESGEIYSCGWGADGQTGLGHYKVESRFTQVFGDVQGEKITKIACKADCVLALNDKGELFGWGNSEYGQLHSKDLQQVNQPMYLKFTNHLGKIVDIASGGSFCLILTDEGLVYVWGYGLLGKGPNCDHSYEPTLIPPVLFGCNDFKPKNKVVSVSCGVSHMAAVTNSGDLYTWGKNRSGCLGLGHNKDQYFPLKVSIGSSVEKIDFGIDHSVAICKPFI